MHSIDLCTALQEALKHIHPPADASATAANAAEDSRLTAGARLSAQQKRVLVDLREAIYTNLGRCLLDPLRTPAQRTSQQRCAGTTLGHAMAATCVGGALAQWLPNSARGHVFGVALGTPRSGNWAACISSQQTARSTYDCCVRSAGCDGGDPG